MISKKFEFIDGSWNTNIENLINFEKEEYNLMAMIALGVSEDDVPNSPPRKDLKEVVTFIK